MPSYQPITAEMKVLLKQQDSLINYIRKQPIIDYVAYSPREDCGYCVPRGVVVACDMATLFKLQDHAKKHYPKMTVIPMTVAECISHMNKPHRAMGDYLFRIKEE